ENEKFISDSFYSNNIMSNKNEISIVELLIERVETLELEVGKIKKEVVDIKTGNNQNKKVNITPPENIVTISDDDNVECRTSSKSKNPYQHSSGKGKSIMEYNNQLPKIGKKLFNSPSSAEKPIKRIRGSPSTTSPGVKRFCKKNLTQASRPRGHTIPKEVKSCFRPNSSMDLTWEESRLSAYIFNDQLDLDEELFMIGDETGTRREFLSLASGRDINEKIYVPIVEDNVHWYLMVVDIDDYTIYKLDTWDMKCYRERRYLDIAKLAYVLEKVLDQPFYKSQMPYFLNKLSGWEIKNGEGQPNLWNSRNSSVWVMQWLEMEDAFMSTVIGELHDENVRMKTALKLVKHDMNKMKKEVKTKCTLMWSKLPFI
ncbi:hypothetical protein Lal_00025868, partial [Lupinus albus]